MEDVIIGQPNEMFDDLQNLRSRFSDAITRPSLTIFVAGSSKIIFSGEEITLPFKNINKKKLDWIFDETYTTFQGCTYSQIKNAVGQVSRTKRNAAKRV